MEWILLDIVSLLTYGRPAPAAVSAASAAWTASAADCEPTELDLWITRQAYEFVADRSECGKCGAEVGGNLSLAVLPVALGEETEAAWRISVNTRCRGWRRHRQTATATVWHGGLRFGTLRCGRSRVRTSAAAW